MQLNTNVTSFLMEGNRVRGVMTDKGAVYARVTISAIGIWSNMLSAWAGIEVPLTLNSHSVFTAGRSPNPTSHICRS